jgi:small multidrug resistance family-3 protein
MSNAEILRSVGLFGIAAIAEIGGAWLVWQSVRAGRGWALALLGGLAFFL